MTKAADRVQSVHRALEVLRLVAAGQERGVRLADIAAASGLAKTTVHRLVRALLEESAVEQDVTTRRYRIGTEITMLGLARPASLSLRSVSDPFLTSLASEVGDTVFLSVLQGGDSVSIARWLGWRDVQVRSVGVGARRPLGASVAGIALLSGLEASEAVSITRRNTERLGQAGAARVDEVLTQVEACRRSGFAYLPSGAAPGTSAVAVPLRNSAGAIAAAISVSAFVRGLPEDRVRRVVASMRSCSEQITARLAEIERTRRRGSTVSRQRRERQLSS